ncbi:UDP-N-acetylmuramoylalanyl-D-glutamyl-2,6-diaminopimelate--D-alanyl-D-alanine ligase [Breoghania sp. L-A4]|uniref:UDP-N-acetylmuramoylalanyl-D-glutamyl-2, 6-diaminopimelate--D-alanyl-D-alanine ligase n=1 Tax=Breoghania sp. L-A4 TaxID=2304600 RepID=UPI003204ED33
MRDALWTSDALIEAVDARSVGGVEALVTGISIDSRTMKRGEAFFAIKGDRFDGHDFVTAAMERGAALAVVADDRLDELPRSGRYVVVPDVLAALEDLGRAARARTEARIVAVTGSVGKTSTKEMLRLAFEACGRTHASVASFNNHWGVPLTLARMPQATEYGVFEIGMNHPGEIESLVAMVRPHTAIITTVEAVHLEHFGSVEAIAKAKSEIFSGLEPGGVAILNADNDQYDLLRFLAHTASVPRVVSFGVRRDADIHLEQVVCHEDCSCASARVLDVPVSYKIGAPGRHLVQNSLAVLGAVSLSGADLARAMQPLARMKPPKGRGERHQLALANGPATLIDESYNANPASMRAAISLLGATPIERPGRRIAVLGDMLELGEASASLHRALARPLEEAHVDLVYCAGR